MLDEWSTSIRSPFMEVATPRAKEVTAAAVDRIRKERDQKFPAKVPLLCVSAAFIFRGAKGWSAANQVGGSGISRRNRINDEAGYGPVFWPWSRRRSFQREM